MRDPNYKSIPLNKAAVSITTNLYDRRALDSTSDRPLVNSLNHLTFLTSSSAKVRETLSIDGGLERLINILHECKQNFNEEDDEEGEDISISKQKQNAIIAWKWTLAFQCLVLIGTRGTEKIRKRVVQAGIIPIIATVLDNYLLISRNFDNQLDNTLSTTFLSLVQSKKPNKQVKTDDSSNELSNLLNLHLDKNYSLHHYLNDNYLKSNEDSITSNNDDTTNINSIDFRTDYPILHQPEQLNDLDLTITSPRLFLKGILIPKEDDVVWSLQLLAFISKYSNLKDFLQYTNLIDSLSLRSLIQSNNIPPPLEQDDLDNELEFEILSNFSSDDNDQNQFINRQQRNQRFQQYQQQFQQQLHQHQRQQRERDQREPDLSNTQSSQDFLQQPSTQQSSTILISNDSNDQIFNQKSNSQDDEDLNKLISLNNEDHENTNNGDFEIDLQNNNNDNLLNDEIYQQNCPINDESSESMNKKCFNKSLLSSILNFEKSCLDFDKISTNLETTTTKVLNSYKELKYLNLVELSIKLNKFYQLKQNENQLSHINKSINIRNEYNSKWNYKSYFQSSDTSSSTQDIDHSNKITHHLNIFPLVEKFTLKTLNSSDMCYWSGVIMRNSCRKDETRGGVRQCASFQCGKWENFPREFAKCRRCKRTKYCSKECQLKAWIYHKHWCVDSNNSGSGSGSTGNQKRDDDGHVGQVDVEERLP
ncbi:hypothetical protein BN7_1865 [Wickerhamomyces ciferrii]|uniref:MYND-type domain-containing protein n=1 Tax=Wickerhamomyces ciferrii (strain ATCC 14091 / BCRC 22168 / CBS 111 / JCM 3599 / NBRC 0793 / NRRL Y-1031 F-60-10) TaxID=1206466 RepID=K0KH61_WICCF|nr:uncharacterized protein BN7_1865 [Wickerhamomyces ciferrii]CCH42321.1 hypothetical protein BN7_1865 [Wickerhamomyces ciferrii]